MENNSTPSSQADLLARLQSGWDSLVLYLNDLSDDQFTRPTDAAGWTVKDHVTHLAVWEAGIDALLNHQPRHTHMGLDHETWTGGDYDLMNEIIRQQHVALSRDEAMTQFGDIHRRLLATLQSLTDEDLLRPYRYYAPETQQERPVIDWIVNNTYEHYEEHIPWMDAIARSGPGV